MEISELSCLLTRLIRVDNETRTGLSCDGRVSRDRNTRVVPATVCEFMTRAPLFVLYSYATAIISILTDLRPTPFSSSRSFWTGATSAWVSRGGGNALVVYLNPSSFARYSRTLSAHVVRRKGSGIPSGLRISEPRSKVASPSKK